MVIYRLGPEPTFPPASEAEPSGLIAVGGDLSPERLLAAYASGIFPWYEEPPVLWFSPDPRAVLPLPRLHVARRLRRTLRQGRFTFTLDGAFSRVIRSCAAARHGGGRGTWITPEMIEAYEALQELGIAHSAESWRDGALVGGVYGVSLGAAFFAESMFHRERDASKAALCALVWQLEAWRFELFDCQVSSPHLTRLGAEEWPRPRFVAALHQALAKPTRRGRWQLDASELAQRLGP